MFCNECVNVANAWGWDEPIIKVEPSSDRFIFSVEVSQKQLTIPPLLACEGCHALLTCGFFLDLYCCQTTGSLKAEEVVRQALEIILQKLTTLTTQLMHQKGQGDEPR